MATRKLGLMAAVLISVVAIFAAACSDDDAKSDNTASQASIDELTARVQRNEEMAAVLQMGTLGLHDMDESLAAGTIESSFVPNTRTAIRLLALTDWEPRFEDDAAQVQTHATDLLKALQAEDVPGAARHAKELHELGHDFTDSVWAVLAADLPADAGGVPPHEDEGDTTPEAGHSDSTPGAGATP